MISWIFAVLNAESLISSFRGVCGWESRAGHCLCWAVGVAGYGLAGIGSGASSSSISFT